MAQEDRTARKNPYAVMLGRRGGLANGSARRPVEDRVASARHAAQARWSKPRAHEPRARAPKRQLAPTGVDHIADPTTGKKSGTWECGRCGRTLARQTMKSGTVRYVHCGPRGFYKKPVRESDMRWPYGASNDWLVEFVNETIPRNVPEQVREEACQELALAVLEGRVPTAKEAAELALRSARSGYQFSAKLEVSMDIPAPGSTSQTPLRDLLAPNGVVTVGDEVEA